MGVHRGYLWLARNEGMDPYGRPYITHYGLRVSASGFRDEWMG